MFLIAKVWLVVGALLAVAGFAYSDTLIDPLHGYCGGVAQCVDNGNNSPTSNDPPINFGFTVSPGPASGVTLLLDILEPNNAPSGAVTITGTYAGTASLYSSTAWTTGGLDSYLGITGSSANPIGAFLPDWSDPSASGFFVYQLTITPVGGVTLQGPSNPNLNPLENITGTIPRGSYIVGFLNEGTSSSPNWISTANSGAILETGTQLPEPGEVVMLAADLFCLGWLHRASRART